MSLIILYSVLGVLAFLGIACLIIFEHRERKQLGY